MNKFQEMDTFLQAELKKYNIPLSHLKSVVKIVSDLEKEYEEFSKDNRSAFYSFLLAAVYKAGRESVVQERREHKNDTVG